MIIIWGCNARFYWHFVMSNKSNLVFLRVVWKWKFRLDSLACSGIFYVAQQLIFEPMKEWKGRVNVMLCDRKVMPWILRKFRNLRKIYSDLCSFWPRFSFSHNNLAIYQLSRHRPTLISYIGSWREKLICFCVCHLRVMYHVYRYSTIWWKPWNVDSFLVWHLPGWSDSHCSFTLFSISDKLTPFIHPSFSNCAACESWCTVLLLGRTTYVGRT